MRLPVRSPGIVRVDIEGEIDVADQWELIDLSPLEDSAQSPFDRGDFDGSKAAGGLLERDRHDGNLRQRPLAPQPRDFRDQPALVGR